MWLSNYRWWLEGFRAESKEWFDRPMQSRFDALVKVIEHETIHLVLAGNISKFVCGRFDRLRTQMKYRVLAAIDYELW